MFLQIENSISVDKCQWSLPNFFLAWLVGLAAYSLLYLFFCLFIKGFFFFSQFRFFTLPNFKIRKRCLGFRIQGQNQNRVIMRDEDELVEQIMRCYYCIQKRKIRIWFYVFKMQKMRSLSFSSKQFLKIAFKMKTKQKNTFLSFYQNKYKSIIIK